MEEQFAKTERWQTHVRHQLDLEDVLLEELGEIDCSLLSHHAMADTSRGNNIFSLPKFLLEHQDDPAVKVMYPVTLWCCMYSDAATHQSNFMLCLRNHLLSWLFGLDFDGDKWTFTPEQHNEVHLVNPDAVIKSKILHVNYTTYDVRWDHNMICMSRGDVVMTYSIDNEHLF